MSEAERRRSYAESRVLISSDAILNTTFDDGDLYFTGEQIELMRNLMQYANRIESYAAEYEPGYYLTPDDTDWDAIQAIVADLEETLMGNPNTIFGFLSRTMWQDIKDPADAGTNTVYLEWTAPNTLHVINGITVFNATSTITTITIELVRGAITYYLELYDAPFGGKPYHWEGKLYLLDGDYVRASFYGCTAGDVLYLQAHGYSMSVPN